MAESFFDNSSISFVGEEISTSENEMSPSQQYVAFEDENVIDIVVERASQVSAIPFEHFIPLCSIIVFLSILLSLAVFLFYRKSKDVTRVYIVAYVVMDLCIVMPCSLLVGIMWYVNLSEFCIELLYCYS